MTALEPAAPGLLIGERYRLEECLSEGYPSRASFSQGSLSLESLSQESLSQPSQGILWRASDLLAEGGPVALRQRRAGPDQDLLRDLWSRLQGVLHPQVPRFGALIPRGDELWLVREWQQGRTYSALLKARQERQLVFGAGEVLLLLRQLLPVLAVLHGQELLHGDLTPANLLRRDRDGLPVLLDFGLLRRVQPLAASTAAGEVEPATPALVGLTPGYAPPALVQGAPPEPWMDLYSLGVVALVLLSGDGPEALLDPVTLAWRWPLALEREPDLAAVVQRMLSEDSSVRFASAGEALQALQALPMPESTGPVPRADRTLVLVPQPSELQPPSEAQPSTEVAAEVDLPQVRPPSPPPSRAAQLRQASRRQEREAAVEGGLWPVVIALVVSAVLGTALGWWWLGRGRGPVDPDAALQLPSSLPAVEVDQRQQLLSRLRALQIDRAWFLKLVDASLLAQYPERGGRLPGDTTADAPLRGVWNELAEEWLARVESLPLQVRSRLGSYSLLDWRQRQGALQGRGLSAPVVRQLVGESAQSLLPGRPGSGEIPPEPFRQLWLAAAELGLDTLQIEAIALGSAQMRVLSAQVEADGARVFPIRLPAGHRLVLGVNGSPLMQMSVFAADGTPLERRGPLRVVSLGAIRTMPVQLLVTNEGLAAGLITLSLRADPPAPAARTPETPGVGPGEPADMRLEPLAPDRPGSMPAGEAAPSETPAPPPG